METLKPPYVLKADGLAAGKGVLILDNLEEAKRELELMWEESRKPESGGDRGVFERYRAFRVRADGWEKL